MSLLKIEDMMFEPLINNSQIQERIESLAKLISADYGDTDPILIGVLNGCYMFISDLSKSLSIQHEIDFIKISSYGDEFVSSGKVKIIKDVSADLKGRHVIVIEDIVDSGLSVNFLRKKFLGMEPASLKFVTLLKKKGTAKIDFEIEYVGFEIEDRFVIGYGLDYKQRYRNLPQVYQLVK